MPRFNVYATANLYGEIRPEGYLASNDDTIQEIEDSTHYSHREIDYELEFNFVVDASDEEDARQLAEHVITTLRYQGDPFEWELNYPEIVELEQIEEPMTLELALATLREWINISNHTTARERPIAVTLNPDLMRAIDFILAHLAERATVSATPITITGPPGIVATTPA